MIDTITTKTEHLEVGDWIRITDATTPSDPTRLNRRDFLAEVVSIAVLGDNSYAVQHGEAEHGDLYIGYKPDSYLACAWGTHLIRQNETAPYAPLVMRVARAEDVRGNAGIARRLVIRRQLRAEGCLVYGTTAAEQRENRESVLGYEVAR